MMGGLTAENGFLEDAPPLFIESGLFAANAIA
jgi:hypothetical protein